VHRLARRSLALQLFDRCCNLVPDCCTLFVAFASENHRLRSRLSECVLAVVVDDQLGGAENDEGVGHSGSSGAL